MVRHFIAPYDIELPNSDEFDKEKLRKVFTSLNKVYEDPKDRTRLRIDSIEEKHDDLLGKYYIGIIEYGKFGERIPVIRPTDPKAFRKEYFVSKEIEEDESPMEKYRYVLYFLDEKHGYLLLERIGNIGVRTALVNAIKAKGAIVKIEPAIVGVEELLKNPVINFSIRVPLVPKLIEERLKIAMDLNDIKYVTITVSARRGKGLGGEKIKEYLRKVLHAIKEQTGNYDTANVGHIIDERENILVTVKVGKSYRTVNLHSGKVRTWFELQEHEDFEQKCLEIIDLLMQERGEIA